MTPWNIFSKDNFVYAEASLGGWNDIAQLKSVKVIFRDDYCLSFYYHMFGRDMGCLRVYLIVYNSNGTLITNEINIFNKRGNLGKLWNLQMYNIPRKIWNKVRFINLSIHSKKKKFKNCLFFRYTRIHFFLARSINFQSDKGFWC